LECLYEMFVVVFIVLCFVRSLAGYQQRDNIYEERRLVFEHSLFKI